MNAYDYLMNFEFLNMFKSFLEEHFSFYIWYIFLIIILVVLFIKTKSVVLTSFAGDIVILGFSLFTSFGASEDLVAFDHFVLPIVLVIILTAIALFNIFIQAKK